MAPPYSLRNRKWSPSQLGKLIFESLTEVDDFLGDKFTEEQRDWAKSFVKDLYFAVDVGLELRKLPSHDGVPGPNAKGFHSMVEVLDRMTRLSFESQEDEVPAPKESKEISQATTPNGLAESKVKTQAIGSPLRPNAASFLPAPPATFALPASCAFCGSFSHHISMCPMSRCRICFEMGHMTFRCPVASLLLPASINNPSFTVQPLFHSAGNDARARGAPLSLPPSGGNRISSIPLNLSHQQFQTSGGGYFSANNVEVPKHLQEKEPAEKASTSLDKQEDKESGEASSKFDPLKILKAQGYKEGQGLGPAGVGITKPVEAALVRTGKNKNVGLGAVHKGASQKQKPGPSSSKAQSTSPKQPLTREGELLAGVLKDCWPAFKEIQQENQKQRQQQQTPQQIKKVEVAASSAANKNVGSKPVHKGTNEDQKPASVSDSQAAAPPAPSKSSKIPGSHEETFRPLTQNGGAPMPLVNPADKSKDTADGRSQLPIPSLQSHIVVSEPTRVLGDSVGHTVPKDRQPALKNIQQDKQQRQQQKPEPTKKSGVSISSTASDNLIAQLQNAAHQRVQFRQFKSEKLKDIDEAKVDDLMEFSPTKMAPTTGKSSTKQEPPTKLDAISSAISWRQSAPPVVASQKSDVVPSTPKVEDNSGHENKEKKNEVVSKYIQPADKEIWGSRNVQEQRISTLFKNAYPSSSSGAGPVSPPTPELTRTQVSSPMLETSENLVAAIRGLVTGVKKDGAMKKGHSTAPEKSRVKEGTVKKECYEVQEQLRTEGVAVRKEEAGVQQESIEVVVKKEGAGEEKSRKVCTTKHLGAEPEALKMTIIKYSLDPGEPLQEIGREELSGARADAYRQALIKYGLIRDESTPKKASQSQPASGPVVNTGLKSSTTKLKEVPTQSTKPNLVSHAAGALNKGKENTLPNKISNGAVKLENVRSSFASLSNDQVKAEPLSEVKPQVKNARSTTPSLLKNQIKAEPVSGVKQLSKIKPLSEVRAPLFEEGNLIAWD